jgi:hypothetical protein
VSGPAYLPALIVGFRREFGIGAVALFAGTVAVCGVANGLSSVGLCALQIDFVHGTGEDAHGRKLGRHRDL